jgi:hypothetical protein
MSEKLIKSLELLEEITKIVEEKIRNSNFKKPIVWKY